MTVRPLGISSAVLWLAGVSLLLPACFQAQSYPEFQLNISPFKNVYLDRGLATLEVWAMEGYTCRDGGTARLYVLYPTEQVLPAPMALVLHPDVFDYVKGNGQHYAEDDRLSADWAASAVEETLGPDTGSTSSEGALIASLLQRNFYIVVPTNCWGDLWHGLGDNAYEEGFFRNGLYFADDALQWGLDNLEVDPTQVLVAGLGEGGRGAYELVNYRGAADTTITALLLDSSPDFLPPVVNGQGCTANSEFVTGLGLIYGMYDPQADDCISLGTLLQTSTLSDVVNDPTFYHRPVLYQYSSNDEQVNVQLSRPAADTLQAVLGSQACVTDWAQNRHIISNNDKYRADDMLDWLLTGPWGDGTETAAPCPQPGD